jgi:serine protease Do
MEQRLRSIRTKLICLGFVCIGLVTGALLVSNLGWVKKLTAVADKSAATDQQIAQGIEKLDEISQVFAAVSKQVNPTVVSIKTERTAQPAAPQRQVPDQFNNTPFGDLFEQFFGMPYPDHADPQAATGSGVIVSADGYVLTNNHVVTGFDRITVTLDDERSFQAKVVGTDPKSDLAVVKIDAKGLPMAQFGNSDNVQIGEWVIAVGNPMGFAHTVTAGIISAKGRNLNLANYESFLQTDAAINPGNSGGALVDLKGRLVGINTAIATQTGTYIGIGFAIPVNLARRVMEDLITKGKVVRGWLGVSIQDVSPPMADALGLTERGGAIVSSIMKDSPADKAGLKAGDIIKKFNGQVVKNSDHLKFMVAETAPNTAARVDVVRNKKEQSFTARITEFPLDETAAAPTVRPQDEAKLGLSVEPVTRDMVQQYGLKDQQGVLVSAVRPGGPAAQAGVEQGDIVREMNQVPVNTVADYQRALARVRPGESVLLLVDRDNNYFFVGVKVPKE